jgi:hypothetical protein
MQPGKGKALDKYKQTGAMIDKADNIKVDTRVKVEHPLRMIKR